MTIYRSDAIKIIESGALILALLTASLYPAQAVAFEADLPTANTHKLVAIVELESDPSYENRLAGAVLARPSVETIKGDWTKKKLAYATADRIIAVPVFEVPENGAALVLEGEASYYSRAGCLGCSASLTMANGQTLNDNALTMAIGADRKHLVGHTAKVTNQATGQSVNVLITDTGGFYQAKYGNRVADLTIATKQAIGMYGGVGQVKVEVY